MSLTTRIVHGVVRTRGYHRYIHGSRRQCCPKSPETELLHHLRASIKTYGPMTIGGYMQEVLTNPVAGYYMHRDVFGTHGDFITSPEISQMFGELIGIWCVNEWLRCGSPSDVQVVELGPGRGTLAADLLRVFSQFEGIRDAVSLHLVEVSPKLSEMQQEKLTGVPSGDQKTIQANNQPHEHDGHGEDSELCYKTCVSKYGSHVSWYKQLQFVPKGFTFYLAHEFFDALPVHKFQKKDNRWHEMLVDIDETEESPHHLRYCLSKSATAASSLLLQVEPHESRDHIELCPQGGVLVEEMANRISEDGGFALIADYGHDGDKTDTFRAFRDHQLFDPLCEPGTADLTADVDFSYLRKIAGNKVATYGPITQEKFLQNMGIGIRLQVLMERAGPEARKNLITGYDMLTNPSKMGERFKFFAMLEHHEADYLPAGFTKPSWQGKDEH